MQNIIYRFVNNFASMNNIFKIVNKIKFYKFYLQFIYFLFTNLYIL